LKSRSQYDDFRGRAFSGSARAAVSIRRNRDCYPASFLQNLARGATVMSLLAVLDAAAIIGSIQWLLLDSFRWSRKTPVEAGNGA